MNKELIIRSNSSAVDFALLKDGKLIELNKEVDSSQFSVGDIFVAKVRKTIPGLNAAFVNIGYEKDGFLHYHDLGPNLLSLQHFIKQVSTGKTKDYTLKNVKFGEEIPKDGTVDKVLKSQQSLLVQVVKEPISTKGPRLSSELSLAGRYMVIMPFSDRVSISPKNSISRRKKPFKTPGKKYQTQRFWYHCSHRCSRAKGGSTWCWPPTATQTLEVTLRQTQTDWQAPHKSLEWNQSIFLHATRYLWW